MILGKNLCMEQVHAYTLCYVTKPLRTINSLIDKLKVHGSPFTLNPNRIIKLSTQQSSPSIILVTEGCFSLYHQEVHRQLHLCFAPSILGIVDGYSQLFNMPNRPRHYIQAETECRGYKVPFNLFLKQIDDLTLWRDLTLILVHRLMVMSASNFETNGVNSYAKIRSLLIEVWLYPEHIRSKTNIQNLIQSRTNLSRSRIMKIILELRKGNYIKVEQGRLVWLGKLPAAF